MTAEESRSQLPAEAEAKAPGKLYIAGEYAVVEQGHPAILVAVDRWLTVHVAERNGREGVEAMAGSVPVAGSGSAASAPAQDSYVAVEPVGRIHSEGHPEASVTWRRRGGRVVPDIEQPGAAFVLAAMYSVEKLAVEAGRDLRTYDVNIESELDDAQSGRKFGLGSSAAVTVATIRALVRFYGLDLTPMQLYKLAFAAVSRAQKVGSGGDIAASLFGGCIRFTAVDRQWVVSRLQDTSLSDLIDMPWPALSVARIGAFSKSPSASGPADAGGRHDADHAMRLLVGWTGSPASTSALVGQVQQHSAAEHERLYRRFLQGSDSCVDGLIQALERSDAQSIAKHIGEARKLLGGLSSFTGTLIETEKLTRLIDIASANGAPAKSSGAGGGDCGIAIAFGAGQAEAIEREWRSAGILPLGVSVAEPLLQLRSWGENSYAQGTGANRKDDHIRLALTQHESEKSNAFDDLRFVHHSLASVSTDEVSISTVVCGEEWSHPFYINAMTGGSAQAGEINEALGRVAGATGLAIASGSQHVALRDPTLTGTFTTLRKHTDGFVFANVGPDVTPEQAVAAVKMIDANALQIHLNAAQEVVMPEGSRDFSAWPASIRRIVEASPVPVVVKEVGFGLSRQSVERLVALGVRTVDVSGRGGTDFAAIENGRRRFHEYGFLHGWGQSTVQCLLDLPGTTAAKSVGVLASGGVRNSLDVVKSLALGAEAVGVSGYFLHVLSCEGEQALIDEIGRWADEVRSLMALLGARTVADLQRTDVLITGSTAENARLLGVDPSVFARRSR